MNGKRRWIEWGKDALMVLLTLSALYLLSMTPLVQDSGVLDLLSPRESPGMSASGESGTAAMLPARLAITGTGGRCGIQYDESRLEERFPPLGALLGDALASAGTPRPISESDWRRYLGGRNIYFDFQGDVPLAALERWLQDPGERPLEGSARRVMLCAGEEDQVLLCWQEGDGGGFFSCPTALTRSLNLDPVVEGSEPNGAYFAFENRALAGRLAPYTLITEGEQDGAQYDAGMPLLADAGRMVLSTLSFNSQNHAPASGGEVYLDGGDRLVVSDNGTVFYQALQGEKYPVAAGPAGGVETARAMAEATVGALCGEARLYLMSAREAEDGLRVQFGYLLRGGVVHLGSEGWAAEFVARDGYIVQFTLRFRTYAANGARTLLLPVDKAAAMLPDLTDQRRELVIQYRDGGGYQLVPGWVAV